MTALRGNHPAHDRIRAANAREGGRHRRLDAWKGESTHAAHDFTGNSSMDRRRCPKCMPTAYARHFARHRAPACNHACDVNAGNLAPELSHYLDCPVWDWALSSGGFRE